MSTSRRFFVWYSGGMKVARCRVVNGAYDALIACYVGTLALVTFFNEKFYSVFDFFCVPSAKKEVTLLAQLNKNLKITQP